MRFLLSIIVVTLLLGCSGSDESETPIATPVQPAPPTPPVLASLTNSHVNCGDWNQQLVGFVPPYSLKNHQRWVIMGSSSAFGAGASSYANSWAGKLTDYAKAEGIVVQNIARGGYNTYQGLSNRCEVSATRFQPDMNHNINKALSFEPDLVIISFPSNDAASNYSAEESAYNLLFMREMLAREDVATVIIGAQPRNMSADKQKLLLDLDVLLVERMKACLVKVYQPLVDSAGNLSASFNAGDGVHMNDAGHAIVFDALKATLTPSSANTCFSA